MINKKNRVSSVVLLIIISALICTIFVIASFNKFKVYADSMGYTISSYNIDVNVNENNVLNIVENIKVNFSEERHGIYRNIPNFNKIQRLDGSTTKQRAIISDINVNQIFDTYIENDNTVIKIGDNDKYVSGEVNYKISYNYNLGKDKLVGNDELYFNLIGNDWNTTISNFTFSITMPKSFDQTKLGFTHGVFGSNETDNIVYSIIDNKISGNYDGILDNNCGLTVRLLLDDNYFVNCSDNDNITVYSWYIMGVCVLLCVSILMFVIINKINNKPVKTVEFYSPNDMNSLDLGHNYKGNATNKDVISLLIYLADKKYLSISNDKNKKEITFKKIKDYDGKNKDEKQFFDKLFSDGNEVKDKDLKNKFTSTINSILKSQNSYPNQKNIYDYSVNKIKYIFSNLFLILTFVYFLICFNPLLNIIIPLSITSLIGLVFLNMFVFYSNNIGDNGRIGMAITEFLILCSITFTLLSVVNIDYFSIGSLTCTLLMLFFSNLGASISQLVSKRTSDNLKLYGRILGFKDFLKNVEKDKLQKLVNDDPQYFYNILPYAYVLGVSDKWIKKFEDFGMNDYMNNDRDFFDVYSMAFFMNSSMNNVSRNLSQISNSNGGFSGGGFSGGGFSGGGSGGGGGGSW